MKKILFIITFISLNINQGAIAQSLLHAKPLDFNAGFAGSKTHDRISFQINQMSGESFNSYVSYDKLVKKLRGGIGFYMNNKQLILHYPNATGFEDRLDIKKVGAVYAPKFILADKYSISPSVSLAYFNFYTQENFRISESNLMLISEKNNHYVESSLGVLLNTVQSYLGYEYKSQWGVINYKRHTAQAGYTQPINRKQSLIFDTRYANGFLIDDYWRSFAQQLNVSYRYGSLFVGGGYNDFSSFSAMFGMKLINLKIATAYHFLQAQHISKFDVAVQYVFNKQTDEKLKLPFERWRVNRKR